MSIEFQQTHIFVEEPVTDPMFAARALIALNTLATVEVGRELFRAIKNACSAWGFQPGMLSKRVFIERSTTACTAIPTTDTRATFRRSLQQPGQGQLLVAHAYARTVQRNVGCSGIVRWNPSNAVFGSQRNRPSYIALAHELIHCLHYVTGTCHRIPALTFDLTVDSGLAEEEARTTGLFPFDNEPLSENAFRRAFGLPSRTEYAPGNDLSHVTSHAPHATT